MNEMDSIRTAHAKAKEEGNTELVEELEQLGPTKKFSCISKYSAMVQLKTY